MSTGCKKVELFLSTGAFFERGQRGFYDFPRFRFDTLTRTQRRRFLFTHNRMNKSYYAVIPANVRYCKTITDGAKLLYGEITALSNEVGYCWATNRYFADLYGKSIDTVGRWISELAQAGFILTLVDKEDGNSRKIWLAETQRPTGKNADTLPAKMPRGSRQKCGYPTGKNAVPYIENNTVNNKEEEEKETAAAENSNLTLKEETKPQINSAPPPSTFIELRDPETPGATIFDAVPSVPSPEFGRVNVEAEVNRLRTDAMAKETFSLVRKIPAAKYDDYLTAFSSEISTTGETYWKTSDFRKHFLNWSEIRYRIEKDRTPAVQRSSIAGLRRL